MKEGAKFEITHFNKKGKKESRSEYEIISKGNNEAKVGIKAYDKKDEMIFDSQYEVMCDEGKFKIDMRGILNSAQLQQLENMKDMEVSVESEDLILPNDMQAGDQLPDGSLTIKIENAAPGMSMMNFTTTMKNRKVEATETVTTDAGTFDCVVITSDIESKFGFMNITYQSKDWYAENVGMVRSETYRKGDLESYSEMTKLEK